MLVRLKFPPLSAIRCIFSLVWTRCKDTEGKKDASTAIIKHTHTRVICCFGFAGGRWRRELKAEQTPYVLNTQSVPACRIKNTHLLLFPEFESKYG